MEEVLIETAKNAPAATLITVIAIIAINAVVELEKG